MPEVIAIAVMCALTVGLAGLLVHQNGFRGALHKWPIMALALIWVAFVIGALQLHYERILGLGGIVFIILGFVIVYPRAPNHTG